MSWAQIHSNIITFSLLFLVSLLLFTGCSVDRDSQTQFINTVNSGNSDVGYEISSFKKQLILGKAEDFFIDLGKMFSLKDENSIITNIDFRSSSNKKGQIGDLKVVDGLKFKYKFFESADKDQRIIFSIKNLKTKLQEDYEVDLVLNKKQKTEKLKILERVLVEVIVSPLSEETSQIVRKEKDALDQKCKSEIGKALKHKNKEITVGDLQIDSRNESQPLTLEKEDINLKVVFTESVDILEPKLVCGKNNVQTYYFPMNYILNKENGSITEFFLTGNGGDYIHGKCREASTTLTSARQIRQVRF